MHKTWIVVADSARARIFKRSGRWQELDELRGMCHPESRLHHGDLKTGWEGATQESVGHGSHQPDWETTPFEKEATRFAQEIAQVLHHGRNQNAFEKLVLIAAPAFLGRLREKLDRPTAGCVVQELDKNWARHPAAEIRSLLERHF